MTKLTYLFLFLSIFGLAQEKDKGNVFSNAGDAAKMAIAKQKLYAEEYTSALNAYREVEQNNQNNSTVKYYVGLCYYKLGQYDNSKKSLEKAIELNKDLKPETHLLLGKIYQHEENFDKALSEYQAFKDAPSADKEAVAECDLMMSQSKNAKTLLAQPLSVEITNLGDKVNSRYDDKNPCITADGSSLVFTTRRAASANAPVDTEGDGKHFEDIYFAALDSATNGFVDAQPVSGAVNTKAHDACTSISPDGKQIFIYYNDANDKEKRGGNVFVSKVVNGKWRKPVSLGKPVNSSYWEGGACVSPDGKKYFFSSERPGGLGNSDIWMVERKSKNEFTEPVNLGPEINTPYDEAGMFMAPDGKTLFFCSNGPGSMGNYDIFKTVFENGKWSAPVNVGYPINSPAREGQLTLSADAQYAYFSSDRKGGIGENDIYRVELKDYAILEKDGKRQGNGLSILRGVIREGGEGYGVQDVEISLKDSSGNPVISTTTNEMGEYFLTLKGGQYQLTVRKNGYKEITENIDLKVSEKKTVTMEKGYLLNK